MTVNRFIRSMAALFAAVALSLVALGAPRAIAGPSLVIDAASGRILQEELAGVPWFPASLTKMLSAYVVFQEIKSGRLKLDSQIEITRYAAQQPASKIGLPTGTRISVDRALQAMIVRSANDIAMALAEGVAGSESRFVKMMNDQAHKLGMTGSFFVNPNGLPDVRQITTARDLALLARALFNDFPEYAHYFKQTVVKIGRRKYRTHNKFLRDFEGADGMKTGYICDSGYNIVASATRAGRHLIAVVLGAESGSKRAKKVKSLLAASFPGGGADDTLAAARAESPRRLASISNWALFRRKPRDMKRIVCKRLGAVRLTRSWMLQKWSVELGRSASASGADAILTRTSFALRPVIYSGKGAVYKDKKKKEFVAVLSILDSDQRDKVFAWFKKKGRACKTIAPVPYEVVVAKLKAAYVARKKARAARRAKYKRRRKAAKSRARSKQRSFADRKQK